MTTKPENVHHAGCIGCTGDYQCSGCGHRRNDINDYSHGYYCVDCVIAIENWRSDERLVHSGEGR